MSQHPVKRSITIAGHETSISLEPLFWDALKDAALQAGLPLNALVAQIDLERISTNDPPNLASAIRVWLFRRVHGLSNNVPAFGAKAPTNYTQPQEPE